MAFHFTIPNASIQDTLRYIVNFVNLYYNHPFSVEFAKEFNPSGDKTEFIKRLFDHICQYGYYQLDEDGEEEVWTPALTYRTRNAQNKFRYDCKKITILLGSVLKAAGIEPVLKHVRYANDGDPGVTDPARKTDGPDGYKIYTHIYIIVPMPDMENYLVVDPTNNCLWNTEVDHAKANLYFLNGQVKEVPAMNLHLMGNPNNNGTQRNTSVLQMFGESAGCIENDMNAIVGCSTAEPNNYAADTVGLSNQYFNFTVAEKAKHIALVPAYAAFRNIFLGLLYLGKLLANTPLKLNITKRIAQAWQMDKNKVRKRWWLVGGTADAKALAQAVSKGSGIAISGPVGKGLDVPVDFVTPWIQNQRIRSAEGVNGPSIGIAPAAVAAGIVTAAPVIIAMKNLLKEMGVLKEGETDAPVPEGTAPPTDPPGPAPGPTPGSMLDLSSPTNTIVKAVFLMGVSGMVTGPTYYILNFFCASAIVFSLVKSFFK